MSDNKEVLDVEFTEVPREAAEPSAEESATEASAEQSAEASTEASEQQPAAGSQEVHIQIASANLPSGEPVVVLMVGVAHAVLPLPLALEVAKGLTEAVAKCECGAPLVPPLVSQISAAGEAAVAEEPAILPARPPVIQVSAQSIQPVEVVHG